MESLKEDTVEGTSDDDDDYDGGVIGSGGLELPSVIYKTVASQMSHFFCFTGNSAAAALFSYPISILLFCGIPLLLLRSVPQTLLFLFVVPQDNASGGYENGRRDFMLRTCSRGERATE